jgi:uncharacterized integral membrane protein
VKPKIFITMILVILFLIFIFQNIETVGVNFLIFNISMPRSLLLIITFAVGLLIGILLPYEIKRNRSKR